MTSKQQNSLPSIYIVTTTGKNPDTSGTVVSVYLFIAKDKIEAQTLAYGEFLRHNGYLTKVYPLTLMIKLYTLTMLAVALSGACCYARLMILPRGSNL